MQEESKTWHLRKVVCELSQESALVEATPCPKCSLLPDLPTQPFQGGQCDVYALIDHTGRALCFRLYRDSGPASSYLLRKEIGYLEEIERHEIKHYQKVIHFCTGSENVFGTPYMILSWAPGRSLSWTSEKPANEQRKRLIAAVARSTMDLLRIQLTGRSAKEYLQAFIQRKLERAHRMSYLDGDVQSCQEQMDLLDKYWVPELERAPFVLVHGDLSANNIIVDDENNFESIVDFGWAEMLPVQFAASFPRFLTHEPIQREAHDEKLSWSNCNNEVMDRDRALYLDCVKTIAESDGGLAAQYFEVLSRPDEVNRYWWLRSVFEPRVHRAMAACRWDPYGSMYGDASGAESA